MRYRWILFDADGVLFDYERAERTALADALALTGRPLQDALLDDYREINDALWRDYESGQVSQDRLRVLRFERLLQRMDVAHDPHPVAERFVTGLAACGALLPGVVELLRSLHGRVGMALITNGIAEVQRSRLERSGIGAFLSGVSISGEVGAAKPDPRIFDHAFLGMGGPPKADVLMVGDSLSSDILGGARYGVDTCWINPRGLPAEGGLEPTFQLARATELLSILEEAGA